MTSMHITQAIGATVITKKEFDKMGPEMQKVLLADSKEFENKVLKTLRADNDKALVSMKQAGLQVVESPPEMIKQFTTEAIAIRTKLEPTVYTHEFRMKVEKLIAEYRAGKK